MANAVKEMHFLTCSSDCVSVLCHYLIVFPQFGSLVIK